MHIGENEKIYKVLEDKIYDLFPGLEGENLKLDYKWEGIIAGTLDDMPKMGRLVLNKNEKRKESEEEEMNNGNLANKKN